MTVYNVQLSPTNNPNDVLHPETSTDVVLLSDGKTLTQKLTDLHQELNRKLGLTGGTLTGNLTAPTFIGALNGNASTATKLQTARQINGVAFDGTKNITVQDATKLPLTGGTLTGSLEISQNLSVRKRLAVYDGIDCFNKKMFNVQAIQNNGKEFIADDGVGNTHLDATGDAVRIGYSANTKRIILHKPQTTRATYQVLSESANRLKDDQEGVGMTKEQIDLLVGLATPSRVEPSERLKGLYETEDEELTVNTGLVMSYLIDTVIYLYEELHRIKTNQTT